ncbi:uncharacterized protein A1O9_02005 [Exophiala aquamarina CBS 119918]|uniref:Xylanolytic transcriptional activator regulatory domain-containing protein n=1 Tax=Exophiala aquamarina CBS 119918 TaxID=1182545 RepID=A0A072PK12_9EURO|nr:uncharacterized protein A1O9_02005 [Exophiala aquamarina CBS 119918]KEF60444.1 hypothetical protein A1O9_02005 [Exophiala aquamarina CBS 119918]
MAVSTTIDDNVDAVKRFQESDVYYQRAYGLCGKLMLRGTSLEIVQCLLLMGQYLQGTQKSIEAWVVHGLAMKAAMQLGLHSSEACKGLPSLEREIRKRTWFGCVIHDRALAMTFGRPCTIPESFVKLELPSERDFYPITGISSSAEARNSLNVHFYVATIQAYRVLWDIIEQLYGHNISCEERLGAGEMVTRLFNLEQRLSSWEHNLHPNLRTLTYNHLTAMKEQARLNADQKIAQTLRIVLTLRCLNLRLLLHRPILVRFLNFGSESVGDSHDIQMLRQIGSHSLQVCMHTADEIISIVHSIVTSIDATRTSVGSWWYTLYYSEIYFPRNDSGSHSLAFNAALVVFGCFLICHPGNKTINSDFTSVTAKDAIDTLNKAIIATQNIDRGNHIVDRCRHYLQLLLKVAKIMG